MSNETQRKYLVYIFRVNFSLRPTELGTVCARNKAAAMSFMCWKNPQLQLSKGNCLRTGRLHILQIGQIRKEYLSALLSCVLNFAYRLGWEHITAAATMLVTMCSNVLYTSQMLYFFTENVWRSFTFQTLCNMVFVSEGRYSLCWLLTSLELLFWPSVSQEKSENLVSWLRRNKGSWKSLNLFSHQLQVESILNKLNHGAITHHGKLMC